MEYNWEYSDWANSNPFRHAVKRTIFRAPEWVILLSKTQFRCLTCWNDKTQSLSSSCTNKSCYKTGYICKPYLVPGRFEMVEPDKRTGTTIKESGILGADYRIFHMPYNNLFLPKEEDIIILGKFDASSQDIIKHNYCPRILSIENVYTVDTVFTPHHNEVAWYKLGCDINQDLKILYSSILDWFHAPSTNIVNYENCNI